MKYPWDEPAPVAQVSVPAEAYWFKEVDRYDEALRKEASRTFPHLKMVIEDRIHPNTLLHQHGDRIRVIVPEFIEQ